MVVARGKKVAGEKKGKEIVDSTPLEHQSKPPTPGYPEEKDRRDILDGNPEKWKRRKIPNWYLGRRTGLQVLTDGCKLLPKRDHRRQRTTWIAPNLCHVSGDSLVGSQ
jgi:hypothetical protein